MGKKKEKRGRHVFKTRQRSTGTATEEKKESTHHNHKTSKVCTTETVF